MNELMNNVEKDVNDIQPGGRCFFAEMPRTGEFIGIREGWKGYSETTIYDLGHCTVMNARAGNTPGEVESAVTCSLFGRWDNFTKMAMEMDARDEEKGLALHKLEPGDRVTIHNTSDVPVQIPLAKMLGFYTLEAGGEMLAVIDEYKDGLIMAAREERLVVCFSYLNGKACTDNEELKGLKITRAPCDHSEYKWIDHPDGSGGQVPFCPACDKVIEL